MNKESADQTNPLIEGIKTIGVGKHGSKPLSETLLKNILLYLTQKKPIDIQKGAFFGSLIAKGPTEAEKELLYCIGVKDAENMEDLYAKLCSDSPLEVKEIGIKLLKKEHLDLNEAYQLGTYLYSALPGETYRGMAVSILRIRYETYEEYHGLMLAAADTYKEGFKQIRTDNNLLIQLSEPFDGVEHSYLITPLIAASLQKTGFNTVISTGRSGGPKLTLNALDIYKELGGFINSNKDLIYEFPEFGRVFSQQDLSPALDKWVDRRRSIFKRPYLATLEKILNPCKADILISSVFHITYIETMITLAALAGFKGVIILKRGLEGTLAPSISKASGITCAVFKKEGAILTQTFDTDTDEFQEYRSEADDTVAPLSLEENIRLIKEFQSTGYTGNTDFDKRTKLALAIYHKGLDWIRMQLDN